MWQNLLFSRLQGLILDQDDLKHCLNPQKLKFISKKSLRPLVCENVMAGGPFGGPSKARTKGPTEGPPPTKGPPRGIRHIRGRKRFTKNAVKQTIFEYDLRNF